MTETTIRKEEFNELLLPFKYNGALIYSKSFGVIPGFFGFHQDTLFFHPLQDMDNEFQIESPDSTEELMTFLTAVEYIIQRIAINKSITLPGHLEDSDIKKVLEHFVDFTRNYEKNVHLVEGIKNGFIN